MQRKYIELTKDELDKAFKDSKNKYFDENFRIQLWFEDGDSPCSLLSGWTNHAVTLTGIYFALLFVSPFRLIYQPQTKMSNKR